MTYYRLYFLAGQHVVNAEGLEAMDDGDAWKQAEAHRNRYSVELWKGDRKIAFLPCLQSEPTLLAEPADA